MHKNFAIIGCGRIAQRHAENIANHGKLVAVCDVIKDKADTLGSKYNARPYYSIQDLLFNEKNLDVVAVCIPNGLHAHYAKLCLNAGVNVLCEKPLCITTQDGKEVIECAKRTGKQLFVVKQNRFNPPVVKLKEILNQERLGKIYSFQLNCFWNRPHEYYTDWKGTKDMDGGTLFTQFSHFIDMLYWMLGDVKHVKAVTKNFHHPEIAFEDTGIVLLEMKNGAIGTLHYTVNTYEQNMEGSFTVFGEKGTIKIGGQYLNTLEYQSIDGNGIEQLPQTKAANDYGSYKGSMSNHDKVYEHLINALNNKEHELINAEEALKTVEIIERIYKSATKK